MFSQAKKIYRAFGGASQLARLLNLPRSTVYKWGYPKDRGGTGGLVPSHRIEAIIRLAKEQDIELDWEI